MLHGTFVAMNTQETVQSIINSEPFQKNVIQKLKRQAPESTISKNKQLALGWLAVVGLKAGSLASVLAGGSYGAHALYKAQNEESVAWAKIGSSLIVGSVLSAGLWIWSKWLENYLEKSLSSQATCGRINISGELKDVEADEYITQLISLFKNEQVRSILLYIDSAGGDIIVSDKFAQAMAQLKMDFPCKPVIAFSSSGAFSAAYWMAATADFIAILRTTSVGSIGVFCQGMLNQKEHNDKEGKTFEIQRTGFKGFPNPHEKTPEEVMENRQRSVNHSFGIFCEDLKKFRPQLIATESKWNSGLVYEGEEAQALGLVDYSGYVDIEELMKTALGVKKVVCILG